MTEIMPFPENNILFYWAAPQGGAFLLAEPENTPEPQQRFG